MQSGPQPLQAASAPWAAEAMGINLARHKQFAFCLSSFFAGVGGALLAQNVDAELLRKLFGGFLVLVGLSEIILKGLKQSKPDG